MHIHLAKSSRFESTDFASVMVDDVGCSVPSVKHELHSLPLCSKHLFSKQLFSKKLKYEGTCYGNVRKLIIKFKGMHFQT